MNTERLTQLSHVMPIAFARLIPLMEVNLLLSGQARHLAAINDARDEAIGRVDERLVRLQRGLTGTAVRLEDQGMQVDFAVVLVGVDEPDRAPVQDFGEASGCEGIENAWLLLLPVHEVEVSVVTGLLPDQCVDAPATADPDVEVPQQVQNPESMLAFHTRKHAPPQRQFPRGNP